MKPGKTVNYYESKGKKQAAVVTVVSGTGASGKKILDLKVEGEKNEVKNVPHGDDQKEGKAFWLLEDETLPPSPKKAGKQ